MKNYAVPQPLTGMVSRSRARVFITLVALLVIGAFVLTRQTHATAPTLGEAETPSQAADAGVGHAPAAQRRPSTAAVHDNSAARPQRLECPCSGSCRSA